jgi:hypothetical protein
VSKNSAAVAHTLPNLNVAPDVPSLPRPASQHTPHPFSPRLEFPVWATSQRRLLNAALRVFFAFTRSFPLQTGAWLGRCLSETHRWMVPNTINRPRLRLSAHDHV